jgi:hypothetical protein
VNDAETIKMQETKIAQLEERIAYLEKGVLVIEKADEYAKRFKAYEEQVQRLATALEAERARVLTAPAAPVKNGLAH